MKIVGLRIEKGQVSAAVVEKDFRRKDLVDSFSQSFATDAELVDILKGKAHDWAGAKIISSIPGRFFTQHLVHFPFTDRKRLEKALPFEVEDLVPFDLGDVVIDHIILGAEGNGKGPEASKESQVLTVMLPKEVLKKHLELLASAGIDPEAIVPSYAGVYALSRMIKAEGRTLFACGSDVCIRNGESVKGLRSFSAAGPTAGIMHTLHALEIEQKERVEKIYVLCPDNEAAFSDLGIAVDQVIPELNGKRPADPLSLGIALAEGINFRRQEFAYRLVDEGMRRRRRTVIFAASVVVLLLVANFAVKFYVVETSYSRLDKEIKAVYHQAVPDAKVVADPVRQLRSSLDEARRKFGALGSGTSALDVMKTVTDSIPKDIRLSFSDFLLEADRLRLQGDAPSFESLDKVKAELQKSPLFADVAVQDTRMGVDNKVKFRLDIKLKQAM